MSSRQRCKSRLNQVSIKTGTWFADSRISLRKSLLLMYCFVQKLNYEHTIRETSVSSAEESDGSSTENTISTSTRTVADYFNYCREVCTWSVECKLATDGKIGSVGMTVEIDESKFGKRKYQRGRLIEGQWVLGGICRETREIFLVALPENKRDRQTLEPLILEHVAPGSTIITDCWKAYDNLGAEGFQHLTVNHSYNFVDPTTGAHTNTVENLWWQIKWQLPDMHTRTDNWTPHLCMWVHVPPAPQRHRLICTVPIRCSAIVPSCTQLAHSCNTVQPPPCHFVFFILHIRSMQQTALFRATCSVRCSALHSAVMLNVRSNQQTALFRATTCSQKEWLQPRQSISPKQASLQHWAFSVWAQSRAWSCSVRPMWGSHWALHTPPK